MFHLDYYLLTWNAFEKFPSTLHYYCLVIMKCSGLTGWYRSIVVQLTSFKSWLDTVAAWRMCLADLLEGGKWPTTADAELWNPELCLPWGHNSHGLRLPKTASCRDPKVPGSHQTSLSAGFAGRTCPGFCPTFLRLQGTLGHFRPRIPCSLFPSWSEASPNLV